MVQRPAAERGHRLVQPGADPRHLRLGDAGVDAQRGDQVVDGPGGDAVDVGLHHHRIQGLVDPPPRLQDHREERALAQLRDLQLHIARPGSPQPRPGAVAVGHPGLGALDSGRRRSALLPRSRSTPASPTAPTRGSDRHPHRHGTPRATRMRQTGTTPSVGPPVVGTWRYTPRIPPMALTSRSGTPTTRNPTSAVPSPDWGARFTASKAGMRSAADR